MKESGWTLDFATVIAPGNECADQVQVKNRGTSLIDMLADWVPVSIPTSSIGTGRWCIAHGFRHGRTMRLRRVAWTLRAFQ